MQKQPHVSIVICTIYWLYASLSVSRWLDQTGQKQSVMNCFRFLFFVSVLIQYSYFIRPTEGRSEHINSQLCVKLENDGTFIYPGQAHWALDCVLDRALLAPTCLSRLLFLVDSSSIVWVQKLYFFQMWLANRKPIHRLYLDFKDIITNLINNLLTSCRNSHHVMIFTS
jgi:hypothetical protein